MYISRLRNIVLETFKCVHKINPPFMQGLFEVKENKYNLRGGMLLDQPKVCTERYGIHTIRYQGARLWNSLPSRIKTPVTVDDFKYHLTKWNGSACKCGPCLSCKLPPIWYLDPVGHRLQCMFLWIFRNALNWLSQISELVTMQQKWFACVLYLHVTHICDTIMSSYSETCL